MNILYSDSTNTIDMSKERFMNLFLINILVDDKCIIDFINHDFQLI